VLVEAPHSSHDGLLAVKIPLVGMFLAIFIIIVVDPKILFLV
jgi:hypothetical protein